MHTKIAVPPAEAAGMLSISRARLYKLLATGELASVRLGGRRLIRVETLAEYIKRIEEEQSRNKNT